MQGKEWREKQCREAGTLTTLPKYEQGWESICRFFKFEFEF